MLCRLALLRWLSPPSWRFKASAAGGRRCRQSGPRGAEEARPSAIRAEDARVRVARTFGVRRTVRDRRARSCGRGAGRSLASRTRRRAQPPNAREPASPDDAGPAGAVFAHRVSTTSRGCQIVRLGAPGRRRHVGDAPWKWRRPERTTSSPFPSSSSRAPLSSHDAAPPPPPRVPPVQIRPRTPNGEDETPTPRTPRRGPPRPPDPSPATLTAHSSSATSSTAHSRTRVPSPRTEPRAIGLELAYFAPATVSSRTAERELVAVARPPTPPRVAEEDTSRANARSRFDRGSSRASAPTRATSASWSPTPCSRSRRPMPRGRRRRCSPRKRRRPSPLDTPSPRVADAERRRRPSVARRVRARISRSRGDPLQ